MTVESPSAHIRPPELLELKMFDSGEDNRIINDSSFHDYARPNISNNNNNNNSTKNNNKLMALRRSATMQPPPMVLIPEHTLAVESGASVYSPGSGLMYETDPMDSNRALLSPCASEALASPMSNNSWRKDSSELLSYFDEESIDLSACTNSPLWSQMDGPPIQDYLPDIINDSGSTDWDDLAALADSPDEFKTKSEPDSKTACSLNTAQSELHNGLKDESSKGPTLAQLNDSDCVLDRKPLTGLMSQSWSSTPSGSILQSDSNTPITTNTMAGWGSPYVANCSLSTAPVIQGKTTMNASLPKASPSLISSDVTKQLSVDSTHVSNMTKLASLLSVNPTVDVQLGVSPVRPMNSQEPLSKSLLTELSPVKTAPANLQGLLCPGSIYQAPVKKPVAVVPHDSQRFITTSGKWKSQDSNGCTSMERKWEEIRDYIDSNKKLDEVMLSDAAKPNIKLPELTKRLPEPVNSDSEPVAKKVKVEVQDVAEITNQEDDDDDSDYGNSDDDFSDIDSDCSYSSFIEDLRNGNKKDKRYFWQYNTQSKGPKGKRLCKSMQERDPHCLADFEDPVFQPDCQDARYKHNGKARKGDGNDITPSPLKLFQIGNELLKLNKKINSIGANIPVKTKDGIKSKSRREKNKFASRACRLKKKAQHEANKLKLFGLEEEHRQLMDVLREIKREIYSRVKTGKIAEGEKFSQLYEAVVKKNLTVMVAGNTADYVNTVLEKVAAGDKTGGIFLDRH